MTGDGATVLVVDDDQAMRESLRFLLESVDLPVETFASGRELLERWEPTSRGCLLLDVRMPGIGGLDLLERLREAGCRIPIVIMTAYADVPMAVRAMRAGALDFIEKPFRDQELLDRIHRALDEARTLQRQLEEAEPIRERYESLTPREKEVMALVVEGLLNKQVAAELDVSIRTVEQHRARVMEKMEADSLAELVRMAIQLEGREGRAG